MILVQTLPVIASLDKALYDNYTCLVSSKKQKINWEEAEETIEKLGNRRVRIRPRNSAIIAFS